MEPVIDVTTTTTQYNRQGEREERETSEMRERRRDGAICEEKDRERHERVKKREKGEKRERDEKRERHVRRKMKRCNCRTFCGPKFYFDLRNGF